MTRIPTVHKNKQDHFELNTFFFGTKWSMLKKVQMIIQTKWLLRMDLIMSKTEEVWLEKAWWSQI